MGRPGLALAADLLKQRERFLGLLRGMLQGGQETWADRDEMERWLDLVTVLMRDMAVSGITGRGQVFFDDDLTGGLPGKGASADVRTLLDSYDRINRLRGKLDFNLNKSITWNYTASLIKATLGDRGKGRSVPGDSPVVRSHDA